MFNGRPYNPSQLMRMVHVDGLSHANVDALVAEVLSHVVTERDPDKLREYLRSFIRQLGESVSIGGALEHLHTVANLPEEFDGGLDGLDALTYHLSGHACTSGIQALQAVLRRFDETPEQMAQRLPNYAEGKYYLGTNKDARFPGIISGPFDELPQVPQGQFIYQWRGGFFNSVNNPANNKGV